MAISNRERLDRGFQELAKGLAPFMIRQLEQVLGQGWQGQVLNEFQYDQDIVSVMRDPQKLLKILTIPPFWNPVFSRTFGKSERTYANECLDRRNAWAHHEPFSYRDTERALDTIERLLEAIPAPKEAENVGKMRIEVQRVQHAELARSQTRNKQIEMPGMAPMAGLKPWRDVVEPHPDVASGDFTKAEFAADLAQVYRGEGQPEYTDPKEFFLRTYMTNGLKGLLNNALDRLTGNGGDPVIELQTNFGGGKTHSMLALYHMAGSGQNASLSGLEEIMTEKGLQSLPQANRAVLVGTNLSTNEPRVKDDGVTTNTLWGEMAWQLGGAEGYAMVANSDKSGTAPGSETLGPLLKKFAPCLILIDEWVAFLRNIYTKNDLLAGSFDANLSFAQALTEAVKATDDTLLVASLPASNMEVGAGGEGGEQALNKLKKTFGRMQSSWQPASSLEGHEIVRRRLFRSKMDFPARDAAIKAFMDMYRKEEKEFPNGVSEADYKQRMESAYPLHPELFERLHNEWGSLEKFQKTRGVLRLMASVISVLWENQDKSLMILPSTIPFDDPHVAGELMRYIEPTWQSVLEKDVDGPSALSKSIDRSNNTLQRFAATRRVARTIFLGATPTARGQNPGIDDRDVRLGCTQPGENHVHFIDALRRLSNQSGYLHAQSSKYWFSTEVTLNKIAAEYAENHFDDGDVENAMVELLRKEAGRGSFSRVHIAPMESADIPDDDELRLVILHPKFGYDRKKDSGGQSFIEEAMKSRGTGARINRNCLVFMAPDQKKMTELESATRKYLAWNKILDQKGEGGLNLDPSKLSNAKSKLDESSKVFRARLHDAWRFVICPVQDDPKNSEIDWNAQSVNGDGMLAERVSRKLKNDLLSQIGPVNLTSAINKGMLWRGENHISTQVLWDEFCKYLFLPKLANRDVLIGCIQNAVTNMTNESFGYADGYDPDKEKYIGLKLNQGGHVMISPESVLVKFDVAKAHIDAAATDFGNDPTPAGGEVNDPGGQPSGTDSEPVTKRFWATAKLDPKRPHRLAGQITEEILIHLLDQKNADIKISLEIEAVCPEGLDDSTLRTIRENCNTLGIEDFGTE